MLTDPGQTPACSLKSYGISWPCISQCIVAKLSSLGLPDSRMAMSQDWQTAGRETCHHLEHHRLPVTATVGSSVGRPIRLLCVTLTHWVYSKGLSNFQGEGEFWWQSERLFPASLLVGDLFIHLRVTTKNGRCDRQPTPPPVVGIHT